MITRRAFATMLMGALSTIWVPVPDDDKPPVVVAKENQKARDHAAIHSMWKEWKFEDLGHIDDSDYMNAQFGVSNPYNSWRFYD